MTKNKSTLGKIRESIKRKKERDDNFVDEFDSLAISREKYASEHPRPEYKNKYSSRIFIENKRYNDEVTENVPKVKKENLNSGNTIIISDEFRQKLKNIAEEEKAKRRKTIFINDIKDFDKKDSVFKWSLFPQKTKMDKIIEFSKNSDIKINKTNIKLYIYKNIKVSQDDGKIVSMDIILKE